MEDFGSLNNNGFSKMTDSLHTNGPFLYTLKIIEMGTIERALEVDYWPRLSVFRRYRNRSLVRNRLNTRLVNLQNQFQVYDSSQQITCKYVFFDEELSKSFKLSFLFFVFPSIEAVLPFHINASVSMTPYIGQNLLVHTSFRVRFTFQASHETYA